MNFDVDKQDFTGQKLKFKKNCPPLLTAEYLPSNTNNFLRIFPLGLITYCPEHQHWDKSIENRALKAENRTFARIKRKEHPAISK